MTFVGASGPTMMKCVRHHGGKGIPVGARMTARCVWGTEMGWGQSGMWGFEGRHFWFMVTWMPQTLLDIHVLLNTQVFAIEFTLLGVGVDFMVNR